MNSEPNLPESEQAAPELHSLLFENSPYGNLDAIVQHDGRAVYFYLNGDESFGTRACWIRNLQAAPLVINQTELQAGLPPLMPKTHCFDPHPQPLPEPENLHILWFEEGNGAALFEHQKPIAVIPPWSGVDSFHGYAAECAMESPIAWPMAGNDQLSIRLQNAKDFWLSCTSESDHPFAKLQPELLKIYDKLFNVEGQYFSLDGGKFPPRGAMVYRDTEQTTVLSVGMSMRPQPNVEMSVEQPASLRRIELGIQLNSNISNEQLQPLLNQFSGLVAYPWQAFTWFGHGHTCQFPQLKDFTDHDSVRFVSNSVSGLNAELALPEFRGDPIQLLWLEPCA